MAKFNEESMISKMESAASEYATSMLDSIFESITYPISCHETEMGFGDLEDEFNSYLEGMTNNIDPYYVVENHMVDDDKILFWKLDDDGYDLSDIIYYRVLYYVNKHKDEYILDLQNWYVDFNAKWCLESPYTLKHLKYEKEECGTDFDLYQSVGNCIYNYCGDGSDNQVRNWVDSHKSEIIEKFANIKE